MNDKNAPKVEPPKDGNKYHPCKQPNAVKHDAWCSASECVVPTVIHEATGIGGIAPHVTRTQRYQPLPPQSDEVRDKIEEILTEFSDGLDFVLEIDADDVPAHDKDFFDRPYKDATQSILALLKLQQEATYKGTLQLAVLNPEWAAKEAKELGLLKVNKLRLEL